MEESKHRTHALQMETPPCVLRRVLPSKAGETICALNLSFLSTVEQQAINYHTCPRIRVKMSGTSGVEQL